MNAEAVVTVKMAEMRMVDDARQLKTTLGSCVGVVLHDSRRSISGMAHIVLPQRLKKDQTVGKYAETAIPELLDGLLKRGSRIEHIRAYLTGGANMFRGASDRKMAIIGDRNVEETKKILGDLKIPIAFEHTGGVQGRTVLFDNNTGEIRVQMLDRIEWKDARQ